MRKMLLVSAAFVLMGFGVAQAGVAALDLAGVSVLPSQETILQLTRNGGDDSGGDDHGGGHNGGRHHDGGSSSDNGDDDGGKGRGRGRGRGGDRDDDDSASNDDSNDDSPASGSKRRKPRVPGGSGCDDAGDIAEHAECRP